MDLKSNGIVTLMDPGSSADSSHKNSGPNEAHTTSQTPIGENPQNEYLLSVVSISMPLALKVHTRKESFHSIISW